MSWHLDGHRIASRATTGPSTALHTWLATCGELVPGRTGDLEADAPSPETRCPHCTWTPPGPAARATDRAIYRHHLAAIRHAHRIAGRPHG